MHALTTCRATTSRRPPCSPWSMHVLTTEALILVCFHDETNNPRPGSEASQALGIGRETWQA